MHHAPQNVGHIPLSSNLSRQPFPHRLLHRSSHLLDWCHGVHTGRPFPVRSYLGRMDITTRQCKLYGFFYHCYRQCNLQFAHGDRPLSATYADLVGSESPTQEKDQSYCTLGPWNCVSLTAIQSGLQKVRPLITHCRSVIVVAGIRISSLHTLGTYADATCKNPYPELTSSITLRRSHLSFQKYNFVAR